jgi:molybdenum cofactor guanylyltransferase
MAGWAGVVLAGGRSSRMGAAKPDLEWHGSTLLRRTVGVVARATEGPVVVVRASGQPLPSLPPDTIVVDDPQPGLGPVQGIAAGLATLDALGGRDSLGEPPEFAFVSSTDLPFLHPAFIRRVLGLLGDNAADVALPVARGFRQPLAAGYRVSLGSAAELLVAADRLRPASLFEVCTVRIADEALLLADPALAAVDPELDSVVNVNEPGEYQAARARPAPEVTVRIAGTIPAGPGGAGSADGQAAPAGPVTVRAATIRGAATAAGVVGDGPVTVTLNGRPSSGDGDIPLATGDAVVFSGAVLSASSARSQRSPS